MSDINIFPTASPHKLKTDMLYEYIFISINQYYKLTRILFVVKKTKVDKAIFVLFPPYRTSEQNKFSHNILRINSVVSSKSVSDKDVSSSFKTTTWVL